jgi:hypothetical protein
MKRIVFALLAMFLFCGIANSQYSWRSVFRTFSLHHTTAAAYTAGDVVGDSTFINFANVGKSGIVNSAYLAFDTSNITNGTFRLYLLRDTTYLSIKMPVIDDNASWTLTSGMDSLIVGYLDFTLVSGLVTATGSANAYITNCNLQFETKNNTLHGVLTATGAYQPKAVGKAYIRIWTN